MKLLREIEIAGASCDYLYARIRCRRAALDVSGQGSPGEQAAPRQALRAEYAWVYRQLDGRLRRKVAPFFEYAELRTLVIALRYLAADDLSEIRKQLQFSQLHPRLLDLLLAAGAVAPVVAALERLLGGEYRYFIGLSEVYLRQGPGGLEQALLGGCLAANVNRRDCPPLRQLLLYLLDMRNLLAVYKHLHWQVPSAPPLLEGGTLDLPFCREILASGDMGKLLELMRIKSEQQGQPADDDVEAFLFAGLTSQLQRAGRDPLQPGLVLDYLWRCLLTARNRGLRLRETPRAQEVAG